MRICAANLNSAIGRRHFQEALISLSYRYRQSVTRTQILPPEVASTTPTRRRGFGPRAHPKNVTAMKRHEHIITPYSARKKNANEGPENSVLNPDTSSDSASPRSNGARIVSAKTQINQRGYTINRERDPWVKNLWRA